MKRTFWGLALIAVGLLAMVQSSGIRLGLSFGPVALTLVGLAITYGSFTRRRGPSWFGLALGLWLAAMGLFSILYDAGLTDVSGGRIASAGWPILLIAAGVNALFGRSGLGVRVEVEDSPDGQSRYQPIGDMRYGRGPWTLTGDLNLTNSVGDLKVDFTTADITPGTHRITVTQAVGETVIKVPDNVTVRCTAEANAGELEILGDARSGVGIFIQREVVVPDSPVELIIDAHQRVGSLKVYRVPAPPLKVM